MPPRTIFALDLSSPIGSAAWVERGEVLAEAEWPQPPRDNRAVFERLRALLFSEGRHPDHVDLWAVGRGPGSYSGLRIALAAVRMFAAPGDQPTVGVDSGLAVADELLMRLPVDEAIVAGDARRGRAWYGRVRRTDSGLAELTEPWSLCRIGELDLKVPPAGCGASAEWTRLAEVAGFSSTDGRWWPEDLVPRARHIARRAELMVAHGEQCPPVVLIYLQPPVVEHASLIRPDATAV